MLRTPLRYSRWLSRASGGDVYLKIEALQPTHSYKIRGATNAILKLNQTPGRVPPIVTASAGNHGRAMAQAAAHAGLPLTVFVPEGAPLSKVNAIRELGAELRPCRDYDEAERKAKAAAASNGSIYISPYAHPDIIAGAGTIGLEILHERPSVEVIVGSIGGGGLVSGLGIAVEGRCEIAGVEVEASTPFTTSFAAGQLVTIDVQPSLADGLTGNLDPDSPTFDLVRAHVRRLAVVSEHELADAIRRTFEHERLIVEGAAAASIAAVLNRTLDLRSVEAALVVSGANIDADKFTALLSQSPGGVT